MLELRCLSSVTSYTIFQNFENTGHHVLHMIERKTVQMFPRMKGRCIVKGLKFVGIAIWDWLK